MTRIVDGQLEVRDAPMAPLVLREVDLPVVHDAPIELWIRAAAPPPERRCFTCGTKLVLRSGYCSACTRDLDSASEGLR